MGGGKINRDIGPAIRVNENFLKVDLTQNVSAYRRERVFVGRDDRNLRFVRLCRLGYASKAAAPNEDGKKDDEAALRKCQHSEKYCDRSKPTARHPGVIVIVIVTFHSQHDAGHRAIVDANRPNVVDYIGC